MAGDKNTVTLTFAGDTAKLDRSFRDVQAGAAATQGALNGLNGSLASHEKSAHAAAAQAQRTAKGFRDLSEAMLVSNNLFPPAIGDMALLATSVTTLGSGVQRLTPVLRGMATRMREMSTASLVLRGGIIGAAAAIAGWAIKSEDADTWTGKAKQGLADMGYAMATNIHFVTQGVPILGSLTGKLQDVADGASQAAHQMDFFTSAEKKAIAAAKEAALFQAPDTNPGGDAFVTSLDLQTIAMQAYDTRVPDHVAKVKKVSAAESEAAKQAKKDLAVWQSTLDQFRGIAKGIQDALAPKLEAGDKGLILFPGMSLLDKLKKQLADTLRFKADIAKLAKAGLNDDLLSQLVSGGLDSLPAAEEILAGGKKGIKAVNATAAAITAAGGSIAGSEATRELNDQKTVKIKVDVSGGDSDMKKLIRKWLRTDKGFRDDVKLAVA